MFLPVRPPTSPRPRARRLFGLFALASLAGCVSYEADPVETRELLAELQGVRLAELTSEEVAPVTTTFDAADGLSLVEASAVAVRRNPRLAALRAQVGVAEARLIQAGLLPDPVIGWESMEAVAGLLVDGKAESPSWLAGFGLTWRVPRPGEIGAKEGVAGARVEGAAARLARAEWLLVRDVHVAYVRLLAARASGELIERLSEISQRALDFFGRARRAGAATALEEALAQVAARSVQADLLAASNERLQARQALNALLGLRPEARWELQDGLDVGELADLRLEGASDELIAESLERRPDVQAALAGYLQAEEQLRLQVALQWPQLQIGTSFSLQIPIFSRLNGPGVETATRARDAARARVRALVHEVRRAVHAAVASAQQAHALLELYRSHLGPQSEQTLQLTERAFEAREVTPLEILTAQRQVLDTQVRFLAARRAWAEARIRLESACGRLLPRARTPLPARQREGQTNDETDNDQTDNDQSEEPK